MADATGPRQRRGQKASDAEPPSSAAAGGRAANDDVDNIEEKIARLVAEKQSTGVSVGSPMPRLLAAACVILVLVVYSLLSYFAPVPPGAAGSAAGNATAALKPRKGKRDRLITLEELALNNGTVKGRPIWLAICGEVFDVTRAPQYYAHPDGGYAFFSGRDGTRAFITGEFNETGLVDDIVGLDANHHLALFEWTEFYHKDYTFVGKLAGGAFYDEKGQPKEMHRLLMEGVEEGRARRKAREEVDNKAPPCDMKWSQAEGGEVWCTGGALPRRCIGEDPLTKKEVVACRCLNDTHFMTGAHTVQVYEGCDPYASHCKTGN